MSYATAIEQLNAMVPELFVDGNHPRRKFSLDQMRTLLGGLGNPHYKFPSVLIAGTNGKGSTASTLASILTVAGLRTGLYTSPHLLRVNERIRVGGIEISDDEFAHQFFRVREVAEQLTASGALPQKPSFFEVLTAMAFCHFADAQIDFAVLEVGMGGRLDATNVVEPLVSVVTDISLDHTEWLGPTIAAIAREKAGILRPHGTFVTLPQLPEANEALGEIAVELGVKAVNAAAYLPAPGTVGPYPIEVLGQKILLSSSLLGEHQHRNQALAIAAAVELAARPEYSAITAQAIEQGVHATVWPGRLSRVSALGREWIVDVAHNPAGAWALRAGLRPILSEEHPTTLLFSCLRDKPVAEMAQILFPLFRRVILAPILSPRATAIADLEAAACATGTPTLVAASVEDALQMAAAEDGSQPVVVAGSVYLAGEVLRIFQANHEGAA